jgi:hypothetical protein
MDVDRDGGCNELKELRDSWIGSCPAMTKVADAS